MQSANPEVDLSVFRGWYSQAGTPTVSVSKEYDEGKREMNIIMEQSLPDVPGQTTKNLLHIPVSVGLISASGRAVNHPCRERNSLLDSCRRDRDKVDRLC